MLKTKVDHALTKRAGLLEKELRRFVSILAGQPDIVGIIVFGSLASEQIHNYSDIDLVVVRETQKPFMQRLHELRHLLHPKVATDLFVYNPEELITMSKKRPFVRKEILQQGKVLYERKRGTLASLCA